MIGQLKKRDLTDNTVVFKMEEYGVLKPGKYKIELLSECHLENIVCDEFGITYEQLHSECQNREHVLARQIMMYYDLIYLNKKVAQVKLRFNKKHSTVIYTRKVINNLLETDKDFKKQFDSIVSRLNEVA